MAIINALLIILLCMSGLLKENNMHYRNYLKFVIRR